MSGRTSVAPRFAIGPAVPAVALRVALALVALVLVGLLLRGGTVWLGLALSGIAVVRPRTGATWLLIALLALGLGLQPRVGWPLLVALLGVHLLAVLTALAAAVPATGRLALAALLPSLRALVLVQVPTQALGALVLVAAGHVAALPVAAVAGGIVLAGLAVVLALRIASR